MFSSALPITQPLTLRVTTTASTFVVSPQTPIAPRTTATLVLVSSPASNLWMWSPYGNRELGVLLVCSTVIVFSITIVVAVVLFHSCKLIHCYGGCADPNDPSQGVQYITHDGDPCFPSMKPRTATFQFICSDSPIGTVLVSEANCNYSFTIPTSYACVQPTGEFNLSLSLSLSLSHTHTHTHSLTHSHTHHTLTNQQDSILRLGLWCSKLMWRL